MQLTLFTMEFAVDGKGKSSRLLRASAQLVVERRPPRELHLMAGKN